MCSRFDRGIEATNSALSMTWLILFTIGALLGLTLAWLGWRGRRMDDQPRCALCGHNLSGTIDRTEVCPECGSHTYLSDALIIGARSREWRIVAFGGSLLMLCACGGMVSALNLRNFNWNPWKPFWLLKTQALTDVDRSSASAREVLDRLERKTITQPQADALIQDVMDVCADPARHFESRCLAIMHACARNGYATPQQVDQFERIMLEPGIRMRMRPTVRSGGWAAFSMDADAWRYSLNDCMPLLDVRSVWIDEQPVRIDRITWPASSMVSWTHPAMGSVTIDAPPGRHAVKMRIGVTVFNSISRTEAEANRRKLNPDDLVDIDWTHDWEQVIEVHPQDQAPVAMVSNAALRDQVIHSISTHNVNVYASAQGLTWTGSLWIEHPPADVAFEVLLQVGDDVHRLGFIACIHDRENDIPLDWYAAKPLVMPSSTGKLILRSTLEAAEQTLDLTEVWTGDEIVINIPVNEAREPIVKTRSPK